MINIGDLYSQTIIATDEIIRDIARVSGDVNPVHLDAEYAQSTVFGGRIAHGLFCLNAISMILGNHLPGEGTILLGQTFKYLRPVYVGDAITVTLVVEEIKLEKNVYTLSAMCQNQKGDVVLTGTSTVKWEER